MVNIKESQNITKINVVPSQTSFYDLQLNPKAVARVCSIKKLFLEISQNSQKNICARVSFLRKLQPLGLSIVLLNSITHAVLY